MTDRWCVVVIALGGLIVQPVESLWPGRAFALSLGLIRNAYHVSSQSACMQPLSSILKALSFLWATLAEPMTEIGTEAY